jgi:pseudaminic acid cytidylyltransferase
MKLAIIPARGGSKRIPRKNIKFFAGYPMIAWSIRAALDSRCFDRIIVSTDDAEIADVAIAHGAEVPFIRPAELSDDKTGTVPVVAHAINWLNQNFFRATEVCCIYATAPFVRTVDLQLGLKTLVGTQADYVFSVTSYPFPIQRAIRMNLLHQVEMFQPEHINTRSQDLEDAWHDAGQFYWGNAQAWLENRLLFNNNSIGLPIPRHLVQDIDTYEDWIRAEWMYKAMQIGSN